MIVQDSHWIAFNFEILLVAIVRWVFHGVSRVTQEAADRRRSRLLCVHSWHSLNYSERMRGNYEWEEKVSFFFLFFIHSISPLFFPLKILNSLSMEHTRIYTVWPAVCVGSAAARYNTTRIVSSSWLILLSFSYFIFLSSKKSMGGKRFVDWWSLYTTADPNNKCDLLSAEGGSPRRIYYYISEGGNK